MSKKKTTQLRELFYSDRTEILPMGAVAVHAQMAERAGYPAVWMSGAMSNLWVHGLPDVGITPRTEVVANARRMVQACDIPVFCDADTGFGGIQNVRQTVKEFYHAGVAGIHIEDQEEPKKSGGRAGMRIVSDEEAVGRFTAACDARDELDPDFVIVARTDAYGSPGGDVDECIRRGKLYRENTGIDAIYFEGIGTWDEIRRVFDEVPGPNFVIPSLKAGPSPDIDELSRIGQAVNVFIFIQEGLQAPWRTLLDGRRNGEIAFWNEFAERVLAPKDEDDAGSGDRFVRPSYDEVREWEEKYLPSDKQRSYDTYHDL